MLLALQSLDLDPSEGRTVVRQRRQQRTQPKIDGEIGHGMVGVGRVGALAQFFGAAISLAIRH